jgi:hypothetical protein
MSADVTDQQHEQHDPAARAAKWLLLAIAVSGGLVVSQFVTRLL